MTWLTQEAQVTAIKGVEQFQVQACVAAGCGSCSLAAGCGQGLLARWFKKRTPQLILNCKDQLQVGDRVLLGLETKQLNKAAMLQFLLPLFFMLGAALLGEFFGLQQSLTQALVGLAGLSLGLLLAKSLATPSQLKILRKL